MKRVLYIAKKGLESWTLNDSPERRISTQAASGGLAVKISNQKKVAVKLESSIGSLINVCRGCCVCYILYIKSTHVSHTYILHEKHMTCFLNKTDILLPKRIDPFHVNMTTGSESFWAGSFSSKHIFLYGVRCPIQLSPHWICMFCLPPLKVMAHVEICITSCVIPVLGSSLFLVNKARSCEYDDIMASLMKTYGILKNILI